jgi:NAD(P)-dependent dehydrogenase (short-subunit alcohol dehydrogenase family)
MVAKSKVLIFGATGAIGASLVDWFLSHDWSVTGVSRDSVVEDTDSVQWVGWNPRFEKTAPEQLRSPFDAVVWAQGLNFSDSIFSFTAQEHLEMYYANVVYIIDTLRSLLDRSLLAKPCRLTVISSIWQEIARQEKMSYIITKSALKGLVQSLVIDLGGQGFLINAILPGALDTPMTKNNLSEKQLFDIKKATPLGSLATLEDVCNLAGFLCSIDNTGITGQFIIADRGFSYARII